MNTLPNLVVFVTGTFINNSCWDDWILLFENEGYKCIAPAWPHKNAPAEELRNRPPIDPIALNTIASLTEHFAAIITALPKKPILIGHSLGGLVVQLLLQQKLALAAVAIHSFPPQGVKRFKLSFLKAIWETMVLFSSNTETYMISFRKWRYSIANGFTYDQQKEFYYKYAVPESKIIIRDTFKCLTKIDFHNLHAPLLFTSGSNDKIIPASMNYRNYKKYATSHSRTDYIEFKGNTHLVFGYKGWKKEADFILYWLQQINKTK